MTAKVDLDEGFQAPLCNTLESTNVVILCFDNIHVQSCYTFNGKLAYLNSANIAAKRRGLVKYKENLVSVGMGWEGGYLRTFIMQRGENKDFNWSIIEPNFKYARGGEITGYSLVNVKSSYPGVNEIILLTGGRNIDIIDGNWKISIMDKVYLFSDNSWYFWGMMRSPRFDHKSIYWNGAVYFIGGYSGKFDDSSPSKDVGLPMEIWNIIDSPITDWFQTTVNWPWLFTWTDPHLFIVPDSFFPDR